MYIYDSYAHIYDIYAYIHDTCAHMYIWQIGMYDRPYTYKMDTLIYIDIFIHQPQIDSRNTTSFFLITWFKTSFNNLFATLHLTLVSSTLNFNWLAVLNCLIILLLSTAILILIVACRVATITIANENMLNIIKMKREHKNPIQFYILLRKLLHIAALIDTRRGS